jgi:hypothetical protein
VIEHMEARSVAPSEILDPDLRTSPLAAFVGGGWYRSTHRPLGHLRDLIRSASPCVVLIGTPLRRPDNFLGWIAVSPSRNTIVHCYVKPAYQRSEFRVGSSLALMAGIDFGRDVPCLTWSSAAAKIAGKRGNPYRLQRVLAAFERGFDPAVESQP